MKNVKIQKRGNVLTIKVDLSERGYPSSSGKSTILASTEGNVPLPFEVGGETVKLGLNLFISAK